MAELLTIARPYAEAVFGTAFHNNAVPQWSSVLDELSALAAHEGVQAMIADPLLSKDQRKQVLFGLIKEQNQPKELKELISILVDNGRVDALPEIANHFNLLKNQHEGSAVAHIISAFDIDDAQLQSLLAGLEKRFGKKLKPKVEIDKSIIGGIRVIVGDQVLDTTVQAKLSRLRESLVAQ